MHIYNLCLKGAGVLRGRPVIAVRKIFPHYYNLQKSDFKKDFLTINALINLP